MSRIGPRIRRVLLAVAALVSLWGAYRLGYSDGLRDQGPDHRALMVVRKASGNSGSSGASATWYDIRNPADAERLRKDQERLTSQGITHYVARGVVERTLSPDPRDFRFDSTR